MTSSNNVRDLVVVNDTIAKAGVQPTHLIVIGDLSTSMEPHVADLKKMLGNFAECTPAAVKCRLALFAWNWSFQTTDYVEPRYMVPSELQADGKTLLFRTVYEVGDECKRVLAEDPNNRILLIVFTDGDDNLSPSFEHKAHARMQELEATVDSSGRPRFWGYYLGLGDRQAHTSQSTRMGFNASRSHTGDSMDDVTNFGTRTVSDTFG